MPYDAIEALNKEQKFESSRKGRFVNWVMFTLGFSKCRYCSNFEFDGNNYRGLRESILLTNGKCKWSSDSASSNLEYEDLRKWHRCPGFLAVLYNFKGYGIPKVQIEQIQGKRWKLFVTWAGWIVAVLVALLSSP